jgi:hypothetical protein
VFASPNSIYGQDAIICADVAVCAVFNLERIKGTLIHYGVEPMYSMLSMEYSAGQHLSVDGKVHETLMNETRMSNFLSDIDELIELLNRNDPLAAPSVARGLARVNAFSVRDYYPSADAKT